MVPDIIPATAEHIAAIAPRVREADRAELWALGYANPEDVLRFSLAASDFACSGTIDGKPICMFGVVTASILGGVGRPWMVGTEDLDRYAVIFLRRCRGQVRRMMEGYEVLENYVDVRNIRAIEWLKWLGFSFNEPELVGPFLLPFIRFERRKP